MLPTKATTIQYRAHTDAELMAIIADHAKQPADIRRIDCRGLAASIVLDERRAACTPSKQPFNIKR